MITANSQAAGVGVSSENQAFAVSVNAKKRVVYLIGTYDPAKTSVVPESPVQVFSPEDVGFRTGYGFMLHRLAKQLFTGGSGLEVYMIPQEETVGAAAAAGSISFVVGTLVPGTMNLYIGGFTRISLAITAGMVATDIAQAIVDAINALPEKDGCPVTAVINGVDAFQVDFTSKSKGTWGNRITLAFDIGVGEDQSTLSGVTATITPMSGGGGVPVIANALNALGTGDNQNSKKGTAVIHGYGKDTTTLDALSNYNGPGDTPTGNYASTVHNPFRSLIANVEAGASGLANAIVFADTRKLDRTNGSLEIPGSKNMPDEVAALAMGFMESISANRPEQNYLDIVLPGVIPGVNSDRWTSTYDNRDIAVQHGLSPTQYKGGSVVLQNVMSFYHPDNVPVANNVYASMRNIAIVQNVLDAVFTEFSKPYWVGISIVADKARVTSAISKVKVRDIDDVKDTLLALASLMAGLGWLYSDEYTKKYMADNPTTMVQIRANMSGFDMVLPVIFSIEGGLYNALVLYDKSIAVLQAA